MDAVVVPLFPVKDKGIGIARVREINHNERLNGGTER